MPWMCAFGVSSWLNVCVVFRMCFILMFLVVSVSESSVRWHRAGSASAHIIAVLFCVVRAIRFSRFSVNSLVCM